MHNSSIAGLGQAVTCYLHCSQLACFHLLLDDEGAPSIAFFSRYSDLVPLPLAAKSHRSSPIFRLTTWEEPAYRYVTLANELKVECEQAPYGRREETIVDTNVRNALQLDAYKVKIGTKMQHVITSLSPSLRTELSCDGFTISALPYKLVLYEEGGFFLIVTQRRWRECLLL